MADMETVKVFDTRDKGRGIRALKCFKAGELVLESLPDLFVLGNNVRGKRCDFCFAPSPDLSRCSKCKFARYCGRKCQSKAWKFHKNECIRTARIYPNVPTDMIRLIARIVDVRYHVSGKESGDTRSLLDELVSNTDKMSSARKEGFSAVITALRLFLREDEMLNSSEMFEIFGKISCNSFTICDGEMQPIGLGLFNTAVLLNHSCDPNCVATFRDTRLQVVATETVKPGDELTISYTELLRPSFKRKEDLREQYGFSCKCRNCVCCNENDALMNSIRCQRPNCQGTVPVAITEDGFSGCCQTCNKVIKEKKVWEDTKFFIAEAEDILEQIKVLQKNGKSNQVLKLCEQTFQKHSALYSDLNYLVINLLDCAMDSCIALELWQKAVDYGLRTLGAYFRFYPKYHPIIGIQLFRIGKLQVHLNQLQDGSASLQQAVEILRVTHGSSHPLVNKLSYLLYETCEELRLQEMSDDK